MDGRRKRGLARKKSNNKTKLIRISDCRRTEKKEKDPGRGRREWRKDNLENRRNETEYKEDMDIWKKITRKRWLYEDIKEDAQIENCKKV